MNGLKGFPSNAVAMKHRNLRDKVRAFEAYGGIRCACCGETDFMFLSLDHISGDGNKQRAIIHGSRYQAGHHTFRWLRLNGYPAGYQVLCMNCNAGRYRNGGVCPHKIPSKSPYELLQNIESLRGTAAIPDILEDQLTRASL